MEPGNLIFGNSRGNWPIPRGKGFEEPITRLVLAIEPKNDAPHYGVDFENDTFSLFKYWWGECDCGFEEQEAAWDEANGHAPDCYATVFRERLKAWENAHHPEAPPFVGHFEEVEPGITFGVSEPNPAFDRTYYDRKRAFQQALADELSRTYRCEASPYGHTCTCSYKERERAFYEAHDHAPSCVLLKPNFLHKPSGLSIAWYKYALRDAYASRQITVRELNRIVDECIASL